MEQRTKHIADPYSLPIFLALIGLILRLIWVLSVDNPVLIDGPWFHETATGIAQGSGYHFRGTPTAFFPVGYPAFLGALYYLFGSNLLVAKLANVFLSALVCLLSFFVASKLFSKTVGVIACLLMAIHPNQIFYTSLIMSEVLFTFLLMLFLFLFLKAQERGLKTLYFFSGVVLGICTLVRSVALLVPLSLLIFWIWPKRFPATRTLRLFALVCSGLLLVLAPWMIRNIIVFKYPVIVSTNGGINFWIAHVKGRYEKPPERLVANWRYAAASPKDEIESERRAYREASEYIRENPTEPLVRLPGKLFRFFYADIDGLLNNSPHPNVASPMQVFAVIDNLPVRIPSFLKYALYIWTELYYVFLFLTAIAGYIKYRNSGKQEVSWIVILMIIWVFVHTMIFFALGRFRFPLAPLFAIFSALFLSHLSIVRRRFESGRLSAWK